LFSHDFGLTNQSESKGISNVLTEGFIFGSLEVGNSILNFGKDVFSIDQNVLTNVHGEAHWGFELLKHGLELLELIDILFLGASLHGSRNDGEGICDVFESLGNSTDVFLLEGVNCILNVSDNSLTLLDAANVVVKILGLKSTNEDTLRDLSNFFSSQSRLGGGKEKS